MKAGEKIIIAGIAGTTLMTLYSYYRSRKESQEYVEPVVMNKLIDHSRNLPEIDDTQTHPTGWALHYGTGVGFITGYYLLWRKALEHPSTGETIIIGMASGVIGILIWKVLFRRHDNPPSNNRIGYYRQLFTAHILFTVAGIGTYKLLDENFSKE